MKPLNANSPNTAGTKLGDVYYNEDFYNSQMELSIKSAEIVLPAILEIIPNVNSAVDFGCGTGAWLSVLKRLGVNEIKGYDGAWAQKKLLIPQECFTAIEFDKEVVAAEKKYDLAISLEVAEHLTEQSAEKFVEILTNASDIVLFSAAIPLQGGSNHINERWQSYWYDIFNKYGFTGTDFPRKKLWNEHNVACTYRQNIVLYVKKGKIETTAIPREHFDCNEQIDCVHPELYLIKMNEPPPLLPLLSLYKQAVKRTIRKIIGEKMANWIRDSLNFR